MKMMKAAMIAALGFSLSACATMDVATRNAPFSALEQTQTLNQLVSVSDVKVNVSRDLRVSEAELFYPVADIVWRGDARGDRYQQVSAIFQDSALKASSSLEGETKARLEIDVLRFHSQTDRTRYTVGGVHSINFVMSLKDPETGIDLIAPRTIKADLKGYGGQDAIAADARGETQKVRITQHLANVIRAEIAGGINVENPVVTRNVVALPASAGAGSIY